MTEGDIAYRSQLSDVTNVGLQIVLKLRKYNNTNTNNKKALCLLIIRFQRVVIGNMRAKAWGQMDSLLKP